MSTNHWQILVVCLCLEEPTTEAFKNCFDIQRPRTRESGVEYTYDVSEGGQSDFDRRFSIYWHVNAMYWTSKCLRCSFPHSFVFNKITYLYLSLSSNWLFSQIATCTGSVIYYNKKFLEINKNFRNFSRNISEENAEYILVSKNMCSDFLLRRENRQWKTEIFSSLITHAYSTLVYPMY